MEVSGLNCTAHVAGTVVRSLSCLHRWLNGSLASQSLIFSTSCKPGPGCMAAIHDDQCSPFEAGKSAEFVSMAAA